MKNYIMTLSLGLLLTPACFAGTVTSKPMRALNQPAMQTAPSSENTAFSKKCNNQDLVYANECFSREELLAAIEAVQQARKASQAPAPKEQ